MRILVTGGSGFFGTRLVPELLSLGHDVTIFDKRPSTTFPDLVTLGDVRDIDALTRASHGVDVIYHLAAEHADDVWPLSLYDDVNVGGAKNVVGGATAENVSSIVFTSSVAVYPLSAGAQAETAPPRPFNRYGRSKHEAEKIFEAWAEQADDRRLVMIRPCVIFGEANRGNVYNLLSQIYKNRFVMVGSGTNRKSIGYIENIVRFLVRCLDFEPGARIFNYADKPDLTTDEFVKIAREALGRNGSTLRVPRWAAMLAGYSFDLLAILTKRSFAIRSIRIRKFCAETTVSTQRITEIGFTPPYTLKEGLRRTIAAEFDNRGNV